jgi:hypothetical protein
MVKLWIQLEPWILSSGKDIGFLHVLSLRTPQLIDGSLICRGGEAPLKTDCAALNLYTRYHVVFGTRLRNCLYNGF